MAHEKLDAARQREDGHAEGAIRSEAEDDWCGCPHSGRQQSQTTQIYTHVMQKPGLGVRSPLDL
ncbi:MAG TPA: hypothetical protein VHF69_00150 [Candidatus Synoicihabitans sp.]|nr:hypothetical protein [Candidatus Synoicihabitans sp.]